MTGGFWAGGIPPWAYVTFAAACLLFLCVGELDGMRRRDREAEEDDRGDEGFGIEQPPELAARRFTRPSEQMPVGYRPGPVWPPPPEVAHEAWLAHEEQALAVANDFGGEGGPQRAGEPALQLPSPPDPRSDSEWTADMAADMTRFLDGLLSAHPATEEL